MGTTVVYVEDEPAVQRLVRCWLEDAGYEVLVAGDGRAGLDLIRAEHPGLVITDALMPEMSGDELVEALVADPHLAAIPVVMLTAAASPLRTRRMLTLGCAAVMTKPIDEAVLLEVVHDALDGSVSHPRRGPSCRG